MSNGLERETSQGQRKLAAIMFTDMVGYSALAQRNEALALELLEEHRAILRPLFVQYRGREIEAIGDAFLVEFESALESTRCAIDIQRVLRERNTTLPLERHIQLRIGLHLGDVVHVGNRVHGDGVNIAARIEPMAEPGGICLSEDIVRQIRNKLGAPILNLGKSDLKNIQSPLDLYKIVLPWEKGRMPVVEKMRFVFQQKRARRALLALVFLAIGIGGYWFWKETKGSEAVQYPRNRIAILPLNNISADQQDEYFADGMTEEIISSLSRINGLDVIARTSVMKYKGTTADISEIGRSLMVGTVLEGSVRKAGDKARITVQLIDVPTQRHLWSEDYDRELKDVFAIQSDIAQRITSVLKIQLFADEQSSVMKQGTSNIDAYREYLLGLFYFNKKTGESLQKAAAHFQQSIQYDSTYALAYTGLADTYTLLGGASYGFDSARARIVEQARTRVAKALDLDPTLAEAYASRAYISFRLDWNWKDAEEDFRRALELKPGYARAHELYALYLSLLGRYDDGIAEMQRAYELDPLSPSVSTGVGRTYQFARRFDEAIAQYKKTIAMDSTYADARFILGITYAERGQLEEGIKEMSHALGLSGRRPVILSMLGYAYAKTGRTEDARRIYRELETLIEKGNGTYYFLTPILYGLGEKEKALDMFEKAYEERSGMLIYMKAEPLMADLHDHPRYHELLRKIGLEE